MFSKIFGKSKPKTNPKDRSSGVVTAVVAIKASDDERSVCSSNASDRWEKVSATPDKDNNLHLVDISDVQNMEKQDKKRVQVKVTEEGFGLIKNLNQSSVTPSSSETKTEEEKKEEQRKNNALKAARNLGFHCVKEKNIKKDYELL